MTIYLSDSAARTFATCCTKCQITGYMVGDRVKWDDPDNQCRWGTCTGVIMKGTDEESNGHFVVYWDNGCTRHFSHKGLESDPIGRPHMKIAFHF